MPTTRLLRLMLATLVLCGMAAPPALGQGTSGLLPPQITVRHALTIAEQLGLSAEQRQAWLQLHDGYAVRYEALYDTDVTWLLEHQDLMSLAGDTQDGFTARDYFDRHAEVLRGIGRLDEELMDTLAPMLTEEQQARLHRARLARARQRWTAGALLWFVQSASVDFVVHGVLPPLDDETMATVEPALASYESAAGPLMQRVHGEAVEMYARIDDTRARLGLDPDDPEDAAELRTIAGNLALEFGGKAFRTGVELGRLQRRTLDRIMAVLPPDDAWTTLERFANRRFRELRGTFPALPGKLARLCSDDSIPNEERTALCDVKTAYLAQALAAARAILNEQERYESSASPFDSGADYGAHQERMAPLRAALEEATAEAERAVAAVDPALRQHTQPGANAHAAPERRTAEQRLRALLSSETASLTPRQREALGELGALRATRAAALASRLEATPETAHDRRQWLQHQLDEVEARTHAWIDAITGLPAAAASG